MIVMPAKPLPEIHCRNIDFQLHVPICDILTVVELEPFADDTIVVGEPCRFRIQCKQVAMGKFADESAVLLQLDMNHDQWVCSGRKRRMLTLRPGETVTLTDIHLLPLKTGLLLLPEILVRRSAIATNMRMLEDASVMKRRHQYFYRNSGKQILVHPKRQANVFWLPDVPEIPPPVASIYQQESAVSLQQTLETVASPQTTLRMPMLALTSPITSPIAVSTSYLRPNLPASLAFLQRGGAGSTSIKSSFMSTVKPNSSSRFSGLLSRVAKKVGGNSKPSTYAALSVEDVGTVEQHDSY